nr:MAG TPA: hypothetical protein [Caudoviricetes sp.]
MIRIRRTQNDRNAQPQRGTDEICRLTSGSA